MTTVYFVQHAIALDQEIDESRPLSKNGRSEAVRVAVLLKNRGIIVRQVFHSGKLRARQTAEEFARVLAIDDIAEHSALNPGDDPATLVAQLQVDHAMYIGHLPNLEKVVTKLICEHEAPAAIKFRNAAVACVEITHGTGQLEWYITPDLC